MEPTQIRRVVERCGATTSFLANPPMKEFHEQGFRGHFRVIAVSMSEDEERWVRGWQFSLFDGDGTLVEERYVDRAEGDHVRALLRKVSDPDAPMGYQYTSQEGVIFKVFFSNQRISVLTPGFSARNGMDGASLVTNVSAFMESSAKLWE